MIVVVVVLSLGAVLVALCCERATAPAESAGEQRIRELCEAYSRDEFGELPESVERLGIHVERALRAEPDLEVLVGIPEPGGLPAAGMGFVAAAEPDGTTCACERCTAWVDAGEWTFPYCSQCHANVDGKCA